MSESQPENCTPSTRVFRSVCVFCGSRAGNDAAYVAAAKTLGGVLAKHNIRLVYGGGSVGLMGAVASAVLEGGGKVFGIIPRALVSRELTGEQLGEVLYVDTMHERKARMASECDAYIALPGGLGTFEELLETMTWYKLGILNNPIGVLNVNGFYDSLLALLSSSARAGFVSDIYAHILEVDGDCEELLEKLLKHRAPESALAGAWAPLPPTLEET